VAVRQRLGVEGIGQITPVRLTDLVAITWPMGDRSGVSFNRRSALLDERFRHHVAWSVLLRPGLSSLT